MALGPPVATKPSGFAVRFCGDRRPSCYVFHTSRQAMIKTYTMKQIAIENGYAQPISVHFTEFLNFHDRLGSGLRDVDLYQEVWGNHFMAWNLVAWCNVPWSGSLFEMATLSQCLHFQISASRGFYHSLIILLKFVTLTLSCFDLERDPLCINSMSNHGASVGIVRILPF